tara:strand:+ start:204 stop:425 length:222 start_codon:yes stop_codon:yes gene_type:complete
MRAARKALLHAKNFLLLTENGQALRLHAGDDPATLLLTMAIHNAEFRYTLEAVLNQANETLDAESESEEPPID